jgi:hypothetical protein
MTFQNNYTNQTNLCYVKRVRTEQFFHAEYQSTITVADFIQQIKKESEQIMNVTSEKIEVVEAGQELSEEGIKMEPEDITMYDKYEGKLGNKAFYVRYVPEN